MDNNTQPNPLPDKVMRRHFELLQDILPDFDQLVRDEGRPADLLLNHYLRTHRELGSRDRRFLSQVMFSYFRWYGWSVGRLKLEPVEAGLLGAMLDATELHSSCEYMQRQCSLPEAVTPAGEQSVSEKCDTLNQWFSPLPDAQPLTLNDLLPAEFEELVDHRVIDRCIAEFQHRPPTWIRSRTDNTELTRTLAKHDIDYTVHEHLPTAISVGGGVSLTHVLGEQRGKYMVQDIASQCVALACSPEPGEEWWDTCAGAGGKSMHLMDLMQQEGKILATDVRIEALKELKKRARRHGIRHIRTQPCNVISDEPFTKTFDGVLVDAPCSGWGTWGRNPDARWRTSKRDVVQSANRQLKILNNAKWCVKPGGVMVYAVCTLTQPETEEIVMNFLDHHENFHLDPFPHPLTGQPTNGQLQIWPWDGPGDAMFITRFRRSGE